MRPPPPPLRRPAAVEPACGLVVAGKYRLTRLLRRGGMGSVWVATHLGLEVPVAVKFMAAAAVSQEARMRFAREAKAAAQIRSTNVVQILDYGLDGGLPYIVMELLEGEDLGARLRRVQRLPLADVARIVGPIARALELAHSKGLVHRDLKPENVFLAREGEHELPKLLDFGIAKAARVDDDPSDGSTREGAIVGTPYFMSPEQARGRLDVDHRSDLWSLGVIVFRAVTGIKPFTSRSMSDVIVKICADPIPRASAVSPDLPPTLDAFFERALAREPSQRFQSARELFNALAAHVPSGQAQPQLAFAPHVGPHGAAGVGTPTPAPSWPSGAGPMHASVAPHATPPPGYSSWSGTPPPSGSSMPSGGSWPSNASWPSQGSWGAGVASHPVGHATGGTLGQGAFATQTPAPPTKTPWLLLGALALVAAASVTAGAVAFVQSRRSGPATAAGESSGASAAAPPSPVASAAPPATVAASAETPPATSASPSASESPPSEPAPKASAKVAASPGKPKAAAAPATATPKRDLGY